eukprot:2324043-Rhodomonas_salina.2
MSPPEPSRSVRRAATSKQRTGSRKLSRLDDDPVALQPAQRVVQVQTSPVVARKAGTEWSRKGGDSPGASG